MTWLIISTTRLPPAGSLQKPAVRHWMWMSVWSRRTSWSTRRRWELTTGTCWLSCLASWMNRSHSATNECPDIYNHHIVVVFIHLQDIMSILSSCAFHVYQLLFLLHSCLYFLSNFFSHFSYTKVFMLPVPPLSLTALCPLFLRLVCHFINLLHKIHRHLATCLSHFIFLHYLSQTASLMPYFHIFLFQCKLFILLLQIPHTRQPGTERHSAYWMANRLSKNPLCPGGLIIPINDFGVPVWAS